MKRPYQLVVFDWEGTLADSIGQVVQTMREQAEILGYLPFNQPALGSGIGLGLTNAIKKGFPHLTHEEQHQLLSAVQLALCTKSPEPYLFPGALALIKQLNQMGVKLAIATNKGQQSFQKALHKAQLTDYFHITRASGQAPPKPDPQMLLEILDACSLKPHEAVMVGDSVSDIQMASSISMDAIGVDFYAQGEFALLEAGAKIIVHHYDELAAYLDVSIGL